MMLNGEEGLEWEIHVDGMQLEHMSEFKYLGCALDESGTDEAECRRKAARGRKVGGTIKSMVNARGLQPEFVMVLNVTLLVHVLMYDNETMIWKEEERSRIKGYRWTKSEVC